MIRALDILLTIVLLPFLIPIIISLMLAIRIETRGNPIFVQKRVGLHGKEFYIIKLRSMVKNSQEIGGYSTIPGDRRVTKVGRVIRATSADELPQLINVLFGSMSLVGPRPDVPEQKSNYSKKDWEKRLSIKPGITGLAQVTYRSSATPDERLKKDLEYAQNICISLYFDILAKTIKLVLTRLAH